MANLYDTPYFRDKNIGLRSLITQPRVEAGINLLQKNKGITDLLTGSPMFGPSAGRAYIRNLSGSTTPITEDFFSEDEINEMRNKVAGVQGRTSIDAANEEGWMERPGVIGYNPVGKNKPFSLSGIFSDPEMNIDMTLGQASFNKDQAGNEIITDVHDFGSLGGAAAEGFYEGPGGYRSTLGRKVVVPPSEPREITYPAWREPQTTSNFDPELGFSGGEEIGGTEWETYEPRYEVNKYTTYPSLEGSVKRAIDAYKKERPDIGASKLARVIGGHYGQVGQTKESYSRFLPTRDWTHSGIPIRINIGKISHRDRMRAFPQLANYLMSTRGIPSGIKRQARPFAVKRTVPTHSPHGGGPGTGGGGGGANLSPGGGYGQSPTGSDIAGTPFSKGGILGAF